MTNKSPRDTQTITPAQIFWYFLVCSTTQKRTTVSRLLAAVPVHLPMILSMHFLWMAALHSDDRSRNEGHCFTLSQFTSMINDHRHEEIILKRNVY